MGLLWLILGIVVGTLSGIMQWWSVSRLAPNATVMTANGIVLGAFARWTVVAVLFIAALRMGAVPALLAFAGLFVAKWLIIVWYGLRE